MRSRHLNRFYLVLTAGCLAALAYHFLMIRPLEREAREMDARAAATLDRLAAAGHGMNSEAVAGNLRRIQADIDAFTEIGRDRRRSLQLPPEIRGRFDRPFQLLDFEQVKFLVVDRIREASEEADVELFEGWEQQFPTYSPRMERPYLLWAQLAVMDQLLSAVIASGIEKVEGIQLITTESMEGLPQRTGQHQEIPVRMQLTGEMEAIHSFLMRLPLSGEEMEALEIETRAGPKSPFFLSRFILKKSSREEADQVSLELLVSGYLAASPALD